MIMTSRGNQRQSCGIRNRRTRRCLAQSDCDFFPGGEGLRFDGDESLRRDLAIGEAVDCDAVARVSRLFSRCVRDGTDRSVEVLAVGAEDQA